MTRIDFPYLMSDRDRHGNARLYVRRHGHKIRIRARPARKLLPRPTPMHCTHLPRETPLITRFSRRARRHGRLAGGMLLRVR